MVAMAPQPAATPAPAAAPAPTPVMDEAAKKAALDKQHHDEVIAASNLEDPLKRRNAWAQILANPAASDENKALVEKLNAEAYQKAQRLKEANDKLTTATPTDLARAMKEDRKEGSYFRAAVLARFGLTDLAQKEMERIDPTVTRSSAVDAQGNRYTVDRDKYGNIIRAFDVAGATAPQEAIARLSAAAMPTQAHLLPSVHGGPVQRTNAKGEIEGGMRMYDPQTQTSYVQIGNQRVPDIGFTTPSQTVQNVFGASQAAAAGKAAGEGFTPQPLQAFPGARGSAADLASSLGIPVISGNRTTAEQQALYDQSVAAGTPGRLPNGNPVAKPGTSRHEQGLAVDIPTAKLSEGQKTILRNNGFIQPLPKTDPNHWEVDPSKAAKGSPVYEQRRQSELATAQGKANIEIGKEDIVGRQKDNRTYSDSLAQARQTAVPQTAVINRLQSSIDRNPEFWGIDTNSPAWTAFVDINSSNENKERSLNQLARNLNIPASKRTEFDQTMNDYRNLQVNAVTGSGLTASQTNTERESQRVMGTIGDISNKPAAAKATLEYAKAKIQYTDEKAKAWAQARRSNPNIDRLDFDTKFDDTQGEKIFNDANTRINKILGINAPAAAQPAATAQPAAGTAKVRRYNPATGRLE